MRSRERKEHLNGPGRLLSRSGIWRRILLALGLIASGTGGADAQCYEFWSGSSATLKVDIGTVLSVIGPIPNSQGGRAFTYSFTGNYTLVIGQSTQVSSGLLGSSAILYAGSPLFTTLSFLLGDPSFKPDWVVNLQGSGDLVPKGLPQTLPDISKWTLPLLGMHNDYISIGSGPGAGQYQIDKITNCAASTVPTVSLSATQLQFAYTIGGALPAPQTISVTNSGGGTLSWFAIAAPSWITLSDTPDSITVFINPVGLSAGTHMGDIVIAAQGATNSPLTIPISLTVTGGQPVISSASHYVQVTPCRIADTRNSTGPFGGPSVTGGASRDFPIPLSNCGIRLPQLPIR